MISNRENQLMIMSNIVQSSPNFISYNKLSGECVYVNPAATTLTGYSNDELMKDYIQVMFGENGKQILSGVLDGLHKHGLVKYEYESKLKDGRIRTFAATSFLIENDAFATIASDITKAKLIQEALIQQDKLTKLMLDSSPLSCQLWDNEFNIFDCNEAAVKLFNFKDKQECIDRFFECSPDYQPDGQFSSEKAMYVLSKAFNEGRYVFEWTHQLPGSDEQIPVEVTLVRVNFKDDYFIAGYTRDLRDITSMELQISRLETEVEKIYYDALTGIYNRRFFDENIKRITKSLSRSGGTLSIMMIDIDHFKKYNDTYGHSRGDYCLETVAKALTRSVTRSEDFVVRYGGEEFAVVLPNTDEIGARMIAEKLLSDIRGRNIPHIGSDTTDFVTISIGVTTGIPSMKKNGEDFIKCADKMLYESKRAGRNRYTYTELQ